MKGIAQFSGQYFAQMRLDIFICFMWKEVSYNAYTGSSMTLNPNICRPSTPARAAGQDPSSWRAMLRSCSERQKTHQKVGFRV